MNEMDDEPAFASIVNQLLHIQQHQKSNMTALLADLIPRIRSAEVQCLTDWGGKTSWVTAYGDVIGQRVTETETYVLPEPGFKFSRVNWSRNVSGHGGGDVSWITNDPLDGRVKLHAWCDAFSKSQTFVHGCYAIPRWLYQALERVPGLSQAVLPDESMNSLFQGELRPKRKPQADGPKYQFERTLEELNCPRIASFVVSPQRVVAGCKDANGFVTLADPAPNQMDGGIYVQIYSGTYVRTPQYVFIQQGRRDATFLISTYEVDRAASVRLRVWINNCPGDREAFLGLDPNNPKQCTHPRRQLLGLEGLEARELYELGKDIGQCQAQAEIAHRLRKRHPRY